MRLQDYIESKRKSKKLTDLLDKLKLRSDHFIICGIKKDLQKEFEVQYDFEHRRR